MKAPSLSSKKIAWVVWAIASIFYAYQYIHRVMPSIMLEDIMLQFGIGTAVLGQFTGLYYVGYALLHLPLGILLDRYGPKQVMTGSILLTVLGMLPLILSDCWVYPMIGRFLIGVGSSGAILSVFKIIRMLFTPKLFPRMLSFSVMIGVIGAIYGGGPVSYMRETFGYSVVVKLFAILGLVLAAVTYWVVPKIEKGKEESTIYQLKEVFFNKKVILSCFFAGLMVGPMEGFVDAWGTSYLKVVGGFDLSVAASLPSLIFVGMCFGSPFLNFLAEKVGNYLAILAAAGLVMAIGFGFLLFLPLTSTFISINFVIIGICCAYQILAVYKASTYVRSEVAGLTTAVANMIIMTFGYVFHTAMGLIIANTGGATEAKAYLFGVGIIPIALLLGSAGFYYLLVQEKKGIKARISS